LVRPRAKEVAPGMTVTATGAMGNNATDPKAFYGYLFEVDKTPTKTLDALLRGIAIYIVSLCCDREERETGWIGTG
jgi:hypothetical protein